ncbi:MAG: hypothetical protein LQ342_007148 [Letrouitia transgressa]|nr:MAG: hypothetical protein LQ342_007148 [Letrouitia transgressa]
MFLVGKGIPDHITSLPQTVLSTPFGQMLKPQLDSAMRGITQAPAAPAGISRTRPNNSARPLMNGQSSNSSNSINGAQFSAGTVHYATTLKKLDALLQSAKSSCAVIFFTSATCPPCKLVYPAYDELAAEAAGKAYLIKVDLSEAHEVGARYQVRATPTFVTFLRGQKESEWVGANEGQLRGNVRMLVQMAHPPHPHTQMILRTLQRHHRAITYAKTPPLEKLIAKLGSRGNDPAAIALKDFVATRGALGALEAPLPNLPNITSYIRDCLENRPVDVLFPVIDLLRCALVDSRVSGYFAGEPSNQTIAMTLRKIDSLAESCPYNLRIVTLHMACNLFTSPLLAKQLLQRNHLSSPLIQLVAFSLLDSSHPPIRVAAATLAFNIAAVNHVQRLDGKEDILSESAQVELAASLLEAVSREEESKDGLKGLLTAIGLLVYTAPREGELVEVCGALGAKTTVKGKKADGDDLENLVAEIEKVL